MRGLSIYLNFQGNTEEAFNFYKAVFGGEFTAFNRFKDFDDENKIPESEKEKIMHIALAIMPNINLMATDSLESMGQKVISGNQVYISLNCSSKEEADRLFNALSENGNIEMPIGETFWGAYFGICDDKFGIKWMFNFDALVQ